MDSMRKNAQKMMPHVMALNKKPTMGMKNDRQPVPAVSKLVAFAKGGKVMAKGGSADMKQDKTMLARHNRLMRPGQKSKLMNGGMVKGYANGGFVTRKDKAIIKAREIKYAKKASEMFEEENKPLRKVKKFLTDNVEKVKKAVRSVGIPDYRDNKLTKVVRSGVNLGKGALNVGKAITPTGAFLTAMTPSTLNEDEDERIEEMNKEFDQAKDSTKIDEVPPKDIKIDMPKIKSINITKKPSPKKEESGEDLVLRYNKKHGGDEDTQEQIKKAFASGPAKYAKGGKVKAKGDKKKVMGTVGEAKAMMAALQKARRPATPMPGTPMAGLGMAPSMAPQMLPRMAGRMAGRMAPPMMKSGGKMMRRVAGGKVSLQGDMKRPQLTASKSFDGGNTTAGLSANKEKIKAYFSKKFAAGGVAKLRKKSPMPKPIKMVNYPRGG